MADYKYEVGDPVWAKMRGYPYWPGRIASPHETNLKNTEAQKCKTPKKYFLVYFFGSNNYGWMAEEVVKPYPEFADEMQKKCKTAAFKKGLKAIDEYFARGGKASLEQPPVEPINDGPESLSVTGDSLHNDANNREGKKLPTIEEELDVIRNSKPASINSKKNAKNSHDIHDDSSSTDPTAPISFQKDYSRTPFNSTKRKTNIKQDDSTEITSPTKRIRSDDDDLGAPSLPSPIVPKSQPPPSKVQARNIITRVQPLDRPIIETPQIDSGALANRYKNIRPSSLKFGFIGLGMMGQRIVRHLLESGHHVTLYNRNHDRLDGFQEAGATTVTTPSDVISASDITFTCVSGPTAMKEIVFSQFGVLSEMTSKKALVDLGSSEPEASKDIADAIISKQGNFLAAPIISSGKTAAQKGDLIIVASGDKAVYEDCASCFKAMAKRSMYLGSDYCQAPKMSLVLSAFYGTIVGSLIECLRLADQLTLKKEDVLDIVRSSSMSSQLVDLIGKKILGRDCALEMPLNYLQRDLKMALNLCDDRPIGCPITAIVNEVYKSRCSFSADEDVTAVFYG